MIMKTITNRISLTLDAAIPFLVLSLSAGFLFVCAHGPVEAQQVSPSTPSANNQKKLTPSRKDNKAPVSPSKYSLLAALPTRETLQRQLKEAMQEEKMMRGRADTLRKEIVLGQTEPGSPLRAQKMRQLEEIQARLADKQALILSQKQLLELYSVPAQNNPGATILPPEPGLEARTLQFTPADAAKLIKRNLLFTPEDQKRVKVLPKSDGGTNKP